jgi:hypothetical protein
MAAPARGIAAGRCPSLSSQTRAKKGSDAQRTHGGGQGGLSSPMCLRTPGCPNTPVPPPAGPPGPPAHARRPGCRHARRSPPARRPRAGCRRGARVSLLPRNRAARIAANRGDRPNSTATSPGSHSGRPSRSAPWPRTGRPRPTGRPVVPGRAAEADAPHQHQQPGHQRPMAMRASTAKAKPAPSVLHWMARGVVDRSG